jgi:hypothetical protein
VHDVGRVVVTGLAARLAVSGGRESIVRLVLTAIGVAIGTTLLLLAAATDPAIRAHQHRQAWQHTGMDESDVQGPGNPLLWRISHDGVAGRTMTVLEVASAGPGAPVPLGLDHVPGVGEVYVSAPLADLLDALSPDRLADRFPSTPAGTIDRRYLAGPDDLVAVVGRPADVLRDAGALAVHHIRTAPAPYQFTDFLRLVLGIAAVGLLMPVLVFVSTSTRLGAARREQRFAALRLAGATPRQTNIVAAFEAGAAAAAGAVLGGIGFLLVRPHAAGIEIDGHPSFVGDVHVSPAFLAAILVAVPALAVVAAMASLRRLQISPLGVARRAVRPRPTVRRLLPLALGTVGFVVSLKAAEGSRGVGMLLPVMATFAVMIYGIVVAGPWLTVLTARIIRRLGRRASALLAGRRLEDDPAAGFRAVSGLVLAVFVASVVSGLTPAVLAEGRRSKGGLVAGSTIVAELPPGTSAASARAALSSAAAAGAGPGVVLHDDPDPGRPLLDPARGRGPTSLVVCAEVGVLGFSPSCPTGSAWLDTSDDRVTFEPAPYPPAQVGAMPATMAVVTTDGSVVTTDHVRTAIERAVPGAVPWLGSEQDAGWPSPSLAGSSSASARSPSCASPACTSASCSGWRCWRRRHPSSSSPWPAPSSAWPSLRSSSKSPAASAGSRRRSATGAAWPVGW